MRSLRAQLSDKAYETLGEFSRCHGISVTAFLEAGALLLGTERREWMADPSGYLSQRDRLLRVVEDARHIDTHRRRRTQS